MTNLTADDFSMKWDREHTFEFMQSEDGTLMAWGHREVGAFLDEVFVFDKLCDPDGAERGAAGDIQHLWAVLDSTDEEDGTWWIRWMDGPVAITEATPGAFAVTLWDR